MKKYKFYNDTFEFNLFLCLWDSKDDKSNRKLSKIKDSLGYDKSQIEDLINTARAFVSGKNSDAYLFFDVNGFNDYPKKERSLRMIGTLQHECNHVKENILNIISEKAAFRETECSMRISDWCFSKCLSVPFFKSKFK